MIVSRPEFVTALALARESCSRKDVSQVLGALRICLEEPAADGGQQLRLDSTDGEVSLILRCPVREASEAEPFCVSADALLTVLRAVTDKELALKIIRRGQGGPLLMVQGTRTRYELPTIDHATFPVRESISGDSLTLTAAMLEEHLVSVAYCIADANRQSIRAVLFDVSPGRLTTMATDNRHMAVLRRHDDTIQTTARFMLSPRSCTTLRKILRTVDGADDVVLTITPGGVQFKSGSFDFLSLLVDGMPQNYEKAIDAKFQHSCNLSPTELRDCLRQVSAVTSATSIRTLLAFEPNRLLMSSEGVGAAHTEMATNWVGDQPVRFCLNPALLLLMFSSMTFEGDLECRFRTSGHMILCHSRPALDFSYIVSPLAQAAAAPAA